LTEVTDEETKETKTLQQSNQMYNSYHKCLTFKLLHVSIAVESSSGSIYITCPCIKYYVKLFVTHQTQGASEILNNRFPYHYTCLYLFATQHSTLCKKHYLLLQTDAHNYKIMGMLKTIKIPTIAPICFGSL